MPAYPFTFLSGSLWQNLPLAMNFFAHKQDISIFIAGNYKDKRTTGYEGYLHKAPFRLIVICRVHKLMKQTDLIIQYIGIHISPGFLKGIKIKIL